MINSQRRNAGRPVSDTYEDGEIAPGARNDYRQNSRRVQQPYSIEPPDKGIHRLVWLIVGMIVVFVLGLIGVQGYAWFMNTFHDPGSYTQTAHLDTVTVTDTQGNRSQVHTFVDMQSRLDLFILPDDASKAHIIVGSALTSIDDPQRAMLIITAKGTTVTVTVQGPLLVSWLTIYRQSEQWSVDISQQKQGG